MMFLMLPLAVSAKVKVVGTLPVFASIAREVGGERVEVSRLVRPNQDPHFLDAKPTFVVALSQADLLLHGGLELEIGWLPPIVVQARNPKINPNTPGNVDLSQGNHLLEISQGKVDRSLGDVHPMGNPHTWFSPNNVKVMAVNISQHLSALDPEGKAYYAERLKTFVAALNQKIQQWEQQTAGFKGKKVITYHKSLSYFTDWTGLEVIDTVEPKPGIPPSSKHVDELLSEISNSQVKAILMESFYPSKVPEYLAEKAHIPLVQIPSDVGDEGTKGYFELMDRFIEKIKGAL